MNNTSARNMRTNSRAARQAPELAAGTLHQKAPASPRLNGQPAPDPEPAPPPEPSPATRSQEFFLQEAPWPRPMTQEAFYGIAGEFVRMVEPHTECDANWLLILFLLYSGNVLGRSRYFMVGGDKHYMKLFAVCVGPTSCGRKGSATGPVEMFFRESPEGKEPGLGHLLTGLSSGEGLIWAIRDAIFKKVRDKQGKVEEQCIDEGESDKRLIVNTGEFFGVLSVSRREGNTLSRIIRDAWDRDVLESPTKNSPAISTGAHVSIAGNISKEELIRTIQDLDADNGLLNRYLWICSRRSKELPEGGRLSDVRRSLEWVDLQSRFNQAALSPTDPILVERDSEASDLWGYDDRPAGIYRYLSRERYGLSGTVTARAAPQVLRLALIYATLDRSTQIRREHLEAAMAVWQYCEDSTAYIFGSMQEDPAANAIIDALRHSPNGMARTEISALFSRHQKADRINSALYQLHKKGLARFEHEKDSGGRPTERWFAVSKA
jgi:hypothetical protein